ncbi:hypothetical protein F4778DRAFT_172765 [Xylariomycetidae sp. FL2044]|nr:hypothetical protein F4778DRAFT_172765 [Xylariomycetidae sp. FL2044]
MKPPREEIAILVSSALASFYAGCCSDWGLNQAIPRANILQNSPSSEHRRLKFMSSLPGIIREEGISGKMRSRDRGFSSSRDITAVVRPLIEACAIRVRELVDYWAGRSQLLPFHDDLFGTSTSTTLSLSLSYVLCSLQGWVDIEINPLGELWSGQAGWQASNGRLAIALSNNVGDPDWMTGRLRCRPSRCGVGYNNLEVTGRVECIRAEARCKLQTPQLTDQCATGCDRVPPDLLRCLHVGQSEDDSGNSQRFNRLSLADSSVGVYVCAGKMPGSGLNYLDLITCSYTPVRWLGHTGMADPNTEFGALGSWATQSCCV